MKESADTQIGFRAGELILGLEVSAEFRSSACEALQLLEQNLRNLRIHLRIKPKRQPGGIGLPFWFTTTSCKRELISRCVGRGSDLATHRDYLDSFIHRLGQVALAFNGALLSRLRQLESSHFAIPNLGEEIFLTIAMEHQSGVHASL